MSGVQVLTFNFPEFLESITEYKGWEEVSGPDSRCGIDYWYECTDEDGEHHSVNINIDQGEMKVIDIEQDETIWQGDCSAAYAKE
jgi:hypothetical protein